METNISLPTMKECLGKIIDQIRYGGVSLSAIAAMNTALECAENYKESDTDGTKHIKAYVAVSRYFVGAVGALHYRELASFVSRADHGLSSEALVETFMASVEFRTYLAQATLIVPSKDDILEMLSSQKEERNERSNEV